MTFSTLYMQHTIEEMFRPHEGPYQLENMCVFWMTLAICEVQRSLLCVELFLNICRIFPEILLLFISKRNPLLICILVVKIFTKLQCKRKTSKANITKNRLNMGKGSDTYLTRLQTATERRSWENRKRGIQPALWLSSVEERFLSLQLTASAGWKLLFFLFIFWLSIRCGSWQTWVR